ncbi:MAG: family 16 glycoside hydrolase, partial [Planctomycetota bacterium]
TLHVNGVLQNEGTKATDTSGKICLQSEGSPIEFRNIYIEHLD